MDLAVDQTNHTQSIRRPQAGWSLSSLGLQPVSHIADQADLLAARRWGRILIFRGELVAVTGRWWPYLGNVWQAVFDKQLRPIPQDRCELFYHVPFGHPGFLTLSYVRSGPRTSLSSFYAATLILDEIARLKQSDAIVCNVTNSRISDRLMQRWGWQAHCLDWPGRHFIKRFYGRYPSIPDAWRERLRMAGDSRLASSKPSQAAEKVNRRVSQESQEVPY